MIDKRTDWTEELRRSTLLSPAPDGSYVAFICGHDLWLYDTTSEGSARVTHAGRQYTQALASVEALISAWSPDSRRILLAVVPGDTECVDFAKAGATGQPGNTIMATISTTSELARCEKQTLI